MASQDRDRPRRRRRKTREAETPETRPAGEPITMSEMWAPDPSVDETKDTSAPSADREPETSRPADVDPTPAVEPTAEPPPTPPSDSAEALALIEAHRGLAPGQGVLAVRDLEPGLRVLLTNGQVWEVRDKTNIVKVKG